MPINTIVLNVKFNTTVLNVPVNNIVLKVDGLISNCLPWVGDTVINIVLDVPDNNIVKADPFINITHPRKAV